MTEKPYRTGVDPRPILLFSGGLDSLIYWRMLGNVKLVYLKTGHAYQAREEAAIFDIGSIYRNTGRLFQTFVVEGLDLSHTVHDDGHVAHRNLLMAAYVAHRFPDAPAIYFGALRGESSRDKSQRFYQDTTNLLSFLEAKPVRVSAPFRNKTKTQLIAMYQDKFRTIGDRNMLLATRSCYAPSLPDGVVGCGVCMACFRRWVAMSNNGITEEYAVNPAEWEFVDPTLNSGAMWAYLANTPLTEWYGLLRNQLDALKAIRGDLHGN